METMEKNETRVSLRRYIPDGLPDAVVKSNIMYFARRLTPLTRQNRRRRVYNETGDEEPRTTMKKHPDVRNLIPRIYRF